MAWFLRGVAYLVFFRRLTATAVILLRLREFVWIESKTNNWWSCWPRDTWWSSSRTTTLSDFMAQWRFCFFVVAFAVLWLFPLRRIVIFVWLWSLWTAAPWPAWLPNTAISPKNWRLCIWSRSKFYQHLCFISFQCLSSPLRYIASYVYVCFAVWHLIVTSLLMLMFISIVSSTLHLCSSLCLSHLVLTRYSRVSPTCTATTLCIAM